MTSIIFNKNVISANEPCISHKDRGFTLGHGLFETMLVKNGVYPALGYHWKRLHISAELIGITLPFSLKELELMLDDLVVKNRLQDKLASARLTVTHGEADRGILPEQSLRPNFVLSVAELPARNDKPYAALIVTTRKNEWAISSRVKSISYIDNILAKKEALEQGYDEAILLNTAGKVADGAVSNVFMVKAKQIITPLIGDGALPGVVRAMLLEMKGDFSIMEKTIGLEELVDADEIFVTNALMGIKSVAKLGNKEWSTFPMASQLSLLLQEKRNYIGSRCLGIL